MKIKIKTLACISTLIGLLGSSAYATIWDLAGDYVAGQPNGVNGVWSYGEISGTVANPGGNVFTPLAWTPTAGNPILLGTYGLGGSSGAYVWQNASSSLAYGIAPGQVSLESDWGASAAVQWTAPSSGKYDIVLVAIGGTSQIAGGGYGNNFAQYSGLNINGVSQGTPSLVNNVRSWSIDDVSLAKGETVDAYVLYPGYANGGNTQTEFTISSVPEPTTIISGVLMLLPFGASTLRILRRNRAA